MSQFYELSEILNDDLYRLATAIQKIHKEPLYHSSILSDLENNSPERLAKFDDTFDILLGMSKDMIKEAAKDITFASIECYINYLKGLLDINGIAFCEYDPNKKMKRETKALEGLI